MTKVSSQKNEYKFDVIYVRTKGYQKSKFIDHDLTKMVIKCNCDAVSFTTFGERTLYDFGILYYMV